MIGHNGSNYQSVMGVIREFCEDWSEILPMGLFFLQNILVVVITLFWIKPHHFNKPQLCKHIGQPKWNKNTSAPLLYFFFSPVGPSIWDEIANNRSTNILRGFCYLSP